MREDPAADIVRICADKTGRQAIALHISAFFIIVAFYATVGICACAACACDRILPRAAGRLSHATFTELMLVLALGLVVGNLLARWVLG